MMTAPVCRRAAKRPSSKNSRAANASPPNPAWDLGWRSAAPSSRRTAEKYRQREDKRRAAARDSADHARSRYLIKRKATPNMNEPLPTALLVEDEPQIRRFVRTALEEEGWQIFESATLQRGLIDAGTRKPDLIVLDLGLPD